jgi:glycosyltransferase involved in cell wall biosynthesis
MPCLNEARTVACCVTTAATALQQRGVPGEVIVADNGSEDGSPELARAAGARVVHIADRGYGNALRGGIAAARGAYVVMGDADGTYDFSQIGLFLDLLDRGFDLVVGNRFRGGIRPGAMPALHRYLGTPVLTCLLRLFHRSRIGDSQCGLRAFRKHAYDSWGLTSTGMELASEMIACACRCGARLAEVPTPLYPDARGRRPHLRPLRDGYRHLRLILDLWRRDERPRQQPIRAPHSFLAAPRNTALCSLAVAAPGPADQPSDF